MGKGKSKWVVAAPDPERAERLARAVGVSNLVAQILVNRGLTEPAAARSFLSPQIADLRDPDEIPGMREAVKRLRDALRNGERVGLFGDYDVDGVSGCALLMRFLRMLGHDPVCYLPHRVEDGYGLSERGIDVLADRGAKLLVTVDCGTTAVREIAYAREKGLDAIVLDHHETDAVMPDAIVANPHRAAPLNPLSSSGICFKVMVALARAFDRSEAWTAKFAAHLPDALALASLGTVADVVPLVGDNRILVRLGLEALDRTTLPGLTSLRKRAGMVDKAAEASDVAFRLAPRLNAAGRLLTADAALEILTTNDAGRAEELAAILEKANTERQKTEQVIFEQARARIGEECDLDRERAIVLTDPRWHVGVVGIVAARLLEEFHRPVVLIGIEGETGRGSARSIEGFNVKEALDGCKDLIVQGGGHARAGGLEIHRDRVKDFRRRFLAIAGEKLSKQDLVATVPIDVEVSVDALGAGIQRELARLSPFGAGNPKPVLAARGVTVAGEPRLMGRDGNHISFFAAQGEGSIRAVAFGRGDLYEDLFKAGRLAIAFTLEKNVWQGRETLELRIRDIQL